MDFENLLAGNWSSLSLEEKQRLIIDVNKRDQACADRIQQFLKDLNDLEQREKLHLARHHQIYALPIAEPMKLIATKKRARPSGENSEQSQRTSPREFKARVDKCIKEEATLAAIEDILLHDKSLLEKCSFEQQHPTLKFTDDDSTDFSNIPHHLLLDVAKFMNPRISTVCKQLKDPRSDWIPVEAMELYAHRFDIDGKIYRCDVRDQHKSRRRLLLSIFQLGAKDSSLLIQRYKTKSRGEEEDLMEKDCPLLDRKTGYRFGAHRNKWSEELRKFVPDLLQIKYTVDVELKDLLEVFPDVWRENVQKMQIEEYELDSFDLLSVMTNLTHIELDLVSNLDIFKSPEMENWIGSTKYIEVFRVISPVDPYAETATEEDPYSRNDWTSHDEIYDKIIIQLAHQSHLAPNGLKDLLFALPVNFETVLEFMDIAKLNSTCVVKLKFVGGNNKQMLDFSRERSVNWERCTDLITPYYRCDFQPKSGGRYNLEFYCLDENRTYNT